MVESPSVDLRNASYEQVAAVWLARVAMPRFHRVDFWQRTSEYIQLFLRERLVHNPAQFDGRSIGQPLKAETIPSPLAPCRWNALLACAQASLGKGGKDVTDTYWRPFSGLLPLLHRHLQRKKLLRLLLRSLLLLKLPLLVKKVEKSYY